MDQIVILVVAQVVFLQFLRGGHVIVEAADQHSAEAAFHRGSGDHLRVEIHIKISGDAAGQILQDRQLAQPIDILRLQLRLHGEYLPFQPLCQRQVVGIGTEEGHGGMGVGVLKAGKEQIPF